MEDSIATMYRQSPLVAFSPASHLQYQCLLSISEDYAAALSKSIDGSNVDGQLLQQAYGYFWLWVLGAYEVVRTLRIISTNRSLAVSANLRIYEREIKILRIPMAKQQVAGKDGVWSWQDAFASGISLEQPDLTFHVQDRAISANALIAGFVAVVGAITFADVESMLDS